MLEHPGISKEIDLEALDHFLDYEYIPAPKTILKKVRKLPAAHLADARCQQGRRVGADAAHRALLAARSAPNPGEPSEQDAAEGLLEVLREAVRLRLIADVPLGALLSGGMDSSIVVALMSELSGRGSRRFRSASKNTANCPMPASSPSTTRPIITKWSCGPSALDVLPKLVRHYGEPFADPSAVPSYYVCAARAPARHRGAERRRRR